MRGAGSASAEAAAAATAHPWPLEWNGRLVELPNVRKEKTGQSRPAINFDHSENDAAPAAQYQ